MRVSGISFTINKSENPSYLVSEDKDDSTVEITAGTKSVIIEVEYTDRAEDEDAQLQRCFDSCDYLEVSYNGLATVRFHSSTSLEGYSDEFLTRNHGFFAETPISRGRMYDEKEDQPEG